MANEQASKQDKEKPGAQVRDTFTNYTRQSLKGQGTICARPPGKEFNSSSSRATPLEVSTLSLDLLRLLLLLLRPIKLQLEVPGTTDQVLFLILFLKVAS